MSMQLVELGFIRSEALLMWSQAKSGSSLDACTSVRLSRYL